MKKALSLIISFLIFVSVFSIIPASVNAAGETHKITIKSTQGLFDDFEADFEANEAIKLRLDLLTDCPLNDGTVHVSADPNQVKISSYSLGKQMPSPITNYKDTGEFLFVFSSGTNLIDTDKGGEFVTFNGKALSGFNSDQEVFVTFKTMTGGRYNTEYDEDLEEYVSVIDNTFSKSYISNSEVINNDFTLSAAFTGKEPAPTEPSTEETTTAAPTQTETQTEKPAETTTATETVTEATTTVAETTTAAPTQTETPTPTETSSSAKHKLTVKSSQNLFPDVSGEFEPGENFKLRLNLRTNNPLCDVTFSAKCENPSKARILSFSSSKSFSEATTNPKPDGEFIFVYSGGAGLVDTTTGGEFVTLKGKTLSKFDSDQVITVDFKLLRGGRYITKYDEDFDEEYTVLDTTFQELYIANSEVLDENFSLTSYIGDKDAEFPDDKVEPATTEPATTTAVHTTTQAATTTAAHTTATVTDAPETSTATIAPTTVTDPPETSTATSTEVTTATAQPTTEATEKTVTTTESATATQTVTETSTQPTTSADGKYNITIKSSQGIFPDTYARFAPGEAFKLKLNLQTDYPLIDITFSAKSDSSQVKITSFTSTRSLSDAITNPKTDGTYNFVYSSGAGLVDTTTGGEFVTLKGKALAGLNSDQVITIDFKLLRGGRYITKYDEDLEEEFQVLDTNFQKIYIASSEIISDEFNLSLSFTGKDNYIVETPTEVPVSTETSTATQSATEAPTTVTETTTAAQTTTATQTESTTEEQITTQAVTTQDEATSEPTTSTPRHTITVKSTQGLFPDISTSVKPGEKFRLTLNLKTSYPLMDGTLEAYSDPTQVKISSYSAPKSLPGALANPKDDGKFILVFSTATDLLDTTGGGEFITLKGKALSSFDSDQDITVTFKTLRGGRYVTIYDEEFDEEYNMVDATFEALYIAQSQIFDTSFAFSSTIIGSEPVDPTTPTTTAEPTTTPAATTTEPPTTTQPPTTTAPLTTTEPPTTTAPVTTTQPATTTEPPTTTEPATTTQPTTAEPTTEPPTQKPTSSDGKYKVTVKSTQNLFPDTTQSFKPGDKISIRLNFWSNYALLDGKICVKYNADELHINGYSAPNSLPGAIITRHPGHLDLSFSAIEKLVDTTEGGEFITLNGSALDTLSSDQEISIEFKELGGGREVMEYDEFLKEYFFVIDNTFREPYIENGIIHNYNFTANTSVFETPEPATTTETLEPTSTAAETLEPTSTAAETLEPTSTAAETSEPTTVTQPSSTETVTNSNSTESVTEDTTASEESTSQTEQSKYPQTYKLKYLPSAEDYKVGYNFKLAVVYKNGVVYTYNFEPTDQIVDGIPVFETDAVINYEPNSVIYQVYNKDIWVSQISMPAYEVDRLSQIILKYDGSQYIPSATTATEETTDSSPTETDNTETTSDTEPTTEETVSDTEPVTDTTEDTENTEYTDKPTESAETTTLPSDSTDDSSATASADTSETTSDTSVATDSGTDKLSPTSGTDVKKTPVSPAKKATAKKANPIKVKVLKKSVKASKLAKKKLKVKALRVKKAKGKVTYKKLKGSKKLKISKKTGKITVKKGTKKGLYKIKVRISAKGNSLYKPKKLTKTVKIRVK
jgi:hypothetical protein